MINKKLFIPIILIILLTGLASASIVFQDDFNRADNDIVGNNWNENEAIGSTWEIKNNYLLSNNTQPLYNDVTHNFSNDTQIINISWQYNFLERNYVGTGANTIFYDKNDNIINYINFYWYQNCIRLYNATNYVSSTDITTSENITNNITLIFNPLNNNLTLYVKNGDVPDVQLSIPSNDFNEIVYVLIQAPNNIWGLSYWDNFIIKDNETDDSLITYNLTTSQSADVTTQAVEEITINATLNYTGIDYENLTGNAYLIHYINTSLNNGCAVFENGACTENSGDINNLSMNKINETSFTLTIDDTHLFPAYYPFNAQVMEGATKTPYYIYKNNYLMWNINNMTTNSVDQLFLALEINGDNLTNDKPLYIYYCNESYDQSSDPTGVTSCELQQAVLSSNLPSHSHGQTKHYVIGVNPSITKTQNSTFVFYTEAVNEASGWWIDYFTNATYTANEFLTGRYGNMNRDTTNIYDIHLHQSLDTDSFNYYVEYKGNGSNAISSVTTDTYDIVNRPPNTPVVNDPCNITYSVDSESNTKIFFNWSSATDPDNDTLIYKVSVRVNNFPLNLFSTNETSYNYYFNTSSNLYHNSFRTKIITCDPSGLCSDTLSSCSFNMCVPNWSLIAQPCTDGVTLYSYEDTNSCGLYNDLPLINGTYVECKTQAESENQTNLFLLISFIVLLVLWFFTRNSIVGIINVFYVLSLAVYSTTITSEGLVTLGLSLIAFIYGLLTYLQMKGD